MASDVCTAYEFHIEAVHVEFDRNWTSGWTVSFTRMGDKYNHNPHPKQLFRKETCLKAFQWQPDSPVSLQPFWGDLVIKSTRVGFDRTDIVTEGDAKNMAKQAEYKDREAHTEIKHTSSFGTCTIRFKVYKSQWYLNAMLELSVGLEFADAKECLRFIQQDMNTLANFHMSAIGSYSLWRSNKQLLIETAPGKEDVERTVIDDIRHAVTPLAFDYCCAQTDAIERGLSRAHFMDELPGSVTKTIRSRGIPTANARCSLLLHLFVYTYIYNGNQLGAFISSVDWNGHTIPTALPSGSRSYRAINNLELNLPTSTSGCNDSSSPLDSDDITVTISARHISILTGTNSLSTGNSVTIDSKHRAIVINHITGDAYFGT